MVVDSLLPTGSATYPASETNNTSLGSTTASTGSPSKDKERSSPPKKKRCRKSTTPAKSSSKEVSFQQLLTQEEATAAAGGGGDHVHAENRAPAQNIWNVASMRPIAGSSAGDQPLKPVMSRVGGGARTAGGGALLATLAAPPAAASVIAQDAAVNAFDRLLANASVPKLVQRGAPVGDASGKGSRQGKRGATQQNSLLGLF